MRPHDGELRLEKKNTASRIRYYIEEKKKCSFQGTIPTSTDTLYEKVRGVRKGPFCPSSFDKERTTKQRLKRHGDPITSDVRFPYLRGFVVLAEADCKLRQSDWLVSAAWRFDPVNRLDQTGNADEGAFHGSGSSGAFQRESGAQQFLLGQLDGDSP